ncbi:hypothetical protein [Streptomyces sp. NPDC057302]|uniref:hypothetical protein n=1 Tax=Streptomyces sp. NPDC057302 TaxID=3346094 RepID=UPI003624CEA7
MPSPKPSPRQPGMIAAAPAQELRPGLPQAPFRSGGFHARVGPLLAKARCSI